MWGAYKMAPNILRDLALDQLKFHSGSDEVCKKVRLAVSPGERFGLEFGKGLPGLYHLHEHGSGWNFWFFTCAHDMAPEIL